MAEAKLEDYSGISEVWRQDRSKGIEGTDRQAIQEIGANAMWFSACLLFENVGQSRPSSENVWEERIVVLNAETVEEAEQHGRAVGMGSEHNYVTATGEAITCKFRHVERVYAIGADEIDHETVVFSRFLRDSEVQSLLTPFPD
jgi:hypothetical protein